MLSKYLDVVKLAFQLDDFGGGEIEAFQDSVDEWFYTCMLSCFVYQVT